MKDRRKSKYSKHIAQLRTSIGLPATTKEFGVMPKKTGNGKRKATPGQLEKAADYVAALEAIREFYGNTVRSREQTMEGLRELRGEIDALGDCLRVDMGRK